MDGSGQILEKCKYRVGFFFVRCEKGLGQLLESKSDIDLGRCDIVLHARAGQWRALRGGCVCVGGDLDAFVSHCG